MEVPTYLLLLLGCLGAADVLLFHSVAHGIRSHPDSAKELVTHSLRGPTYAALFLSIPNFAMQGLFAWALVALFVFDVAISIWDFSLERGSRRVLGGLPSGEYVLHMLMAIVFGALVAAFLYGARAWFTAPTRLIYAPATVSAALRLALLIMAILVLLSAIQDAAAAFRLKTVSRQTAKSYDAVSAAQPRSPVVASINRAGRAGAIVAPLPPPAGWMRIVLLAAGIYNLLWGAWVVSFPAALFQWAAMAPINYPQIWQSVGMIVGVYGIGYLIASKDPFRHWPIILVGLMGKVLGPAGMLWSVTQRTLPGGMAWICLANDLIWWAPFTVILVCALLNQRQAELGAKLDLP